MLEIQPILYGSDNFTTIATPGKSSDPGAMTALFAAFGAAACSPAFDPVQNLPTLLPWRLKIPQDGYPFDGTSIVDSAETWWWYDCDIRDIHCELVCFLPIVGFIVASIITSRILLVYAGSNVVNPIIKPSFCDRWYDRCKTGSRLLFGYGFKALMICWWTWK